tara:strand:+ start:186 stop:464 length:279 start_codon:yes stop_codon:yes gene_type:complete
MNPMTPHKGIRRNNEFWIDHVQRIGALGDGDCTCDEPNDNYECLLEDAKYYAECTEWDMPGWGFLIRSARGIVRSFDRGAVKRFQDRAGLTS